MQEAPNDPSSATLRLTQGRLAAIRLRQGYGGTGEGRADCNRDGPPPASPEPVEGFAAAHG